MKKQDKEKLAEAMVNERKTAQRERVEASKTCVKRSDRTPDQLLKAAHLKVRTLMYELSALKEKYEQAAMGGYRKVQALEDVNEAQAQQLVEAYKETEQLQELQERLTSACEERGVLEVKNAELEGIVQSKHEQLHDETRKHATTRDQLKFAQQEGLVLAERDVMLDRRIEALVCVLERVTRP